MIRKKDNGANEVLRKYRVGVKNIKAGFVGERAERKHKNSNLTNAELAAIHEFGLGDQTAKHFIRDSFDENYNINRRELKKLLILFMRGRISERKLRKRFGDKLVQQIKTKISQIDLIDTGELRNSVDWEVED